MKISILLFGVAKDIIGNKRLSLETSANVTVLDLKNILLEKYPAFYDLSSISIAVNSAYANNETVINENDEVAIIPPVSGG